MVTDTGLGFRNSAQREVISMNKGGIMMEGNIFKIAQEGTFEEFYSVFNGDTNQMSNDNMNLRNVVLTSNSLLEE